MVADVRPKGNGLHRAMALVFCAVVRVRHAVF